MTPCLILSPDAHAALVQMRDRHPTPYLRERAGALLKVAAGQSPTAVAQQGLTRPRHRDTVNAWVAAYQAHGLAGLVQQPRRRAFSP
jgi:transposase